MKLKLVYDKKEDIPEAYRDLYTESDGKFNFTGVEGIKTDADIERLTTSLQKERDAHKETKGKLKDFEGLDPKEVREKLDKLPELEALAKGGEGLEQKIEEAAKARVTAATAPLERDIAKLRGENETLTKEVGSLQQNISKRAFSDTLGGAARAAKVAETAIEDIVLVAQSHFETVDGKLVTKEGGPIAAGLGPSAYFSEMQALRPHWWPNSQGGGAKGGGPSGGGGPNPWKRETWNMTEQGRIMKENRTSAEELAKAAGTTIGGGMPPAAPKK